MPRSSLNNTIQQLDVGKAAGPDGLPGEALQLAGLKIGYLLALVFNCCFVHGFLPVHGCFNNSVVKNKCGNVTDKNYRPIATASVTSKILESVLERIGNMITTTDNQFGFKRAHSH